MKYIFPFCLIIFSLSSCIQNREPQPLELDHEYTLAIVGGGFTQEFSGSIPNQDLIAIYSVNQQQPNEAFTEVKIESDDYIIEYNLAFSETIIKPLGALGQNKYLTSNIRVTLKGENENTTLVTTEGDFTVTNINVTQFSLTQGVLSGSFNFTGELREVGNNSDVEILISGRLTLNRV